MPQDVGYVEGRLTKQEKTILWKIKETVNMKTLSVIYTFTFKIHLN
jgi:hypothetical protein